MALQISSWIDDDPNWGKALNVPEYTSNPIVVTVLSLFLITAIILFAVNLFAAYSQYKLILSLNPKTRPSLITHTRTRLNCLQVLGSFMNMLNQIYFLTMELGRWLPCEIMVTMGGFIYSSMIMSLASVMIHRSTTLLKGRHRTVVRAVMYSLILLAAGTIAASNALRQWNEGLRRQGVCSAKWNRKLNTIGKGCIVVLYTWFIFVFVRPLYKHSRSMNKLVSRRTDATSKRINAIVHMLFIKIILCVSALVAGTVLGTFQLFGRYFTVEFSIQNTAMVYASTLALERFGRRRDVEGNSTSGTASLMDSTTAATTNMTASATGGTSQHHNQATSGYQQTRSAAVRSNAPMNRPSGPTPTAATSPRTASFATALLPPQLLNSHAHPGAQIHQAKPMSPAPPESRPPLVRATSLPSAPPMPEKVPLTADSAKENKLAVVAETTTESQSRRDRKQTDSYLRRVCSGVWIGDENDSTVVENIPLPKLPLSNSTSLDTLSALAPHSPAAVDHVVVTMPVEPPKPDPMDQCEEEVVECWVEEVNREDENEGEETIRPRRARDTC
ncbi:hypothetical protein BCR44DRAFT_56061 [Catenaria anguillulae PL171]|uniref:Uncharacterized protein n=1 Tax=Catenaria anguillulae PL171 TaxID=765915 RepID=A0A1Y2HK20_9FUNG|nr:hypothetical protein BCR44DRAFT_56061 [Catenaria anguillulae PL171]